MSIGVILNVANEGRCLDKAEKLGLSCVQLQSWNMAMCRDEVAKAAREDAEKRGVRISSFWAGYPGPSCWNFLQGPATLGFVPVEYRWARIEALKAWARFAHLLGAPAIVTHAGFLPENAADPEFQPVVVALRQVAVCCEELGLGFWFETGQETPVTLLRYMHAIGTSNLGINLDPANLMMYGKGNPVDALHVFGAHVKSVHVKDGCVPTDPMHLGAEKPLGEGQVDFPALLKGLKAHGFNGDLIIEREISGEEQERDIRMAIEKITHWTKEIE